MYAWIWRHIPFGRTGKVATSLLLVGSAMALLWFVVFPLIDPWVEETLLPWDQSQLTGDWAPTDGPIDELDPDLVGPDGEILDDPHDIPYDTEE